MGDKKIVKTEINTITQGAITLGIICVFFLLFRGVTNILNAFMVPLALYAFSIGKNKRDIMTEYLLVIIFSLLFFNMQTIFIIFYCGISLVLNKINDKNYNLTASVILLSIIVAISFYLAILLTDYLFLTQINSIMMRVLNNNILLYSIILFIEGLVIGTSLILISRKLHVPSK